MALSKQSETVPPDFIVERDEKRSVNNRVILRANLKSEEDVKAWLTDYKFKTKTDWIVKENFKSLQKVAFHKYWHCQLSSLNKRDGTKRNKKCEVQLDILIKKVNRDTIKNDVEFLKRETPLPAVITIKGTHNHPCGEKCHETLGFLRISEKIKDVFYNYFDEGISPAQAIRSHETKLLMEEDGPIKLSDSSVNPSPRTVYHLHDMWRESEYGKAWNSDPLSKLKEKVTQYKSQGVDVHIDEENPDSWAVLVVTPIMKRAQNETSAGEIIFIDSTSSVESSQSTLTLILCATKGGAIPIAKLIHSGQSTENYSKGFSLLKENYPQCFGGKSAPEVFMTDHSDAEKAALKNVWPEAAQHLCNFHIGQSEWRWLLKGSNNILQDKRQYLMSILQKMMYANDTEAFESAVEELYDSGVENYIKHVESELLPIKEQWVAFFRSEVLNRGHKTNNYSEASIRVFKDIILLRMKCFNVTSMTDTIVNVWEPYYAGKLLHYAYNRISKPILTYKRLCDRMPPELAKKIKKEEDGVFWVPSANADTPDLYYEVQGSIGWCSCPIGKHGAFCKHQALVHKEFGGLFPNQPVIDGKARHQLARLALGEKCPEPTFFMTIKEFQESQQQVPEEAADEQANDCEQADDLTAGPVGIESMTADPEHVDTQTENATTVQYEEARNDVLQELTRILELGENSTSKGVFSATLKRLACRLKNVTNPNQALTTVLAISSRAGSSTRRGGRINVQPTSTSRRRTGVSRGSSRIPSGRPPKTPSGTRAKPLKRLHKLSNSVKMNRCHPQAHGH